MWRTHLIIHLLYVSVGRSHLRNNTSRDEVELQRKIDEILEGEGYNNDVRPTKNATVVFVDVAVNALGPVNDRDMKLGASFYLRQEWLDPRLQIPDFNGTVVLSYKQVKGLWVPDLFFPQSETEIRHEITTPNVLLRLGSDGNVFYSQRLTVVFQCSMNLHKFPMDEQTCHIRMESFDAGLPPAAPTGWSWHKTERSKLKAKSC